MLLVPYMWASMAFLPSLSLTHYPVLDKYNCPNNGPNVKRE